MLFPTEPLLYALYLQIHSYSSMPGKLSFQSVFSFNLVPRKSPGNHFEPFNSYHFPFDRTIKGIVTGIVFIRADFLETEGTWTHRPPVLRTMRSIKARIHRRYLSRQLDATFVALKLHQVSNMFETPAISRRQFALKIAPCLHL